MNGDAMNSDTASSGSARRDSPGNHQRNAGGANGKVGQVLDRHEKIHELIQTKGYVTIEHLAQAFKVTPQTIRRDIHTLSERGVINRYHGGAGVSSSTENVAYVERKILCHKEKKLIAAMVARQIPNNSSLFINIGTTTEEIAKALCNHQRLKVITNNLNVAFILSTNVNFEVIVAGGMVRHRDGGLIGLATVDFIQQFRVDYGIIGISGIDFDGTLLDFDYLEVRAARAIIDNSRKIFLATDHTKFSRSAMVRLGNIAEIDTLFTDQNPPSALVEVLTKAEVNLCVANGPAAD